MELHESILVIEKNAALQKTLQEYRGSLEVECADPERLDGILEKKYPRAVIFNLNNPGQTLPELLERGLFKNGSGPQPYLALSGEAPTAGELIDYMRLGIQDFLRLPPDQAELDRFFLRLEKWQAQSHAVQTNGSSRLLAFFSFKGGVGTSLAAVNLAASLAGEAGENVLLTDWVLQHGNTAELTDVQPKYNLADFFHDRERVDTHFVENSFARHRSGLYVLPSPRQPEDSETIDAEAVTSLVGLFRQHFTSTVMDAGHEFNTVSLACLDQADTVYLLLVPELTSVCAAQRALEVFAKLGYPKEKVQLVLNRARMRGGLDAALIEKNLRHPFACQIPDDPKGALRAVNQGVLFRDMGKSSPAAAVYRDWAKKLMTPVSVQAVTS